MDSAPDKHEALRDVIARTDRILDAAIAKLDARFGAGYAQANPDLVATYLEVAAQSLDTDLSNAALAQGDAHGFLVGPAQEFN